MADASSNGSGSSGHSESRRRTLHTTDVDVNSTSTNSEACSSGHYKLLSYMQGEAAESYEDKVIAKKAVQIVLNATRKQAGFKGAVSLCTEFSDLLYRNRRLEQIVYLQKNELLSCKAKLKKNGSLSDRSNKSIRRETETKAIQIKPVLVGRSTSPLLKEVYVKNSSDLGTQTEQTEFLSSDAKGRLVKDASDRGCPNVEERDEVKIQNNMTKAEENWLKVQEENIQLKKELIKLENELESFKKRETLVFPVISEGQPTVSQTVASLAKQVDQQSKGKSPVPNHENELPQIPQARIYGQAVNNKPRVCNPHQQKKGFRPFSSPYKVSPNPQSHLKPIRPIEMYSQCKCPGCVQALSEEEEVLCARHTTDIDKKSPKRSEILPHIGDHVVVRSHLTGLVMYVGPVNGEKKSYVGLYLDSPVGNNNGSVDGVHYFSCPPSYGALVPVDEVLCVTSSHIVKDKRDTGARPASQRSSSSPSCQTPKKARTLYKENYNDKKVKA